MESFPIRCQRTSAHRSSFSKVHTEVQAELCPPSYHGINLMTQSREKIPPDLCLTRSDTTSHANLTNPGKERQAEPSSSADLKHAAVCKRWKQSESNL